MVLQGYEVAIPEVKAKEVAVSPLVDRTPVSQAGASDAPKSVGAKSPTRYGRFRHPGSPCDLVVGQRAPKEAKYCIEVLLRTHVSPRTYVRPPIGRTGAAPRYDSKSSGHWPKWTKAPVSKTGDSRFESWVPRFRVLIAAPSAMVRAERAPTGLLGRERRRARRTLGRLHTDHPDAVEPVLQRERQPRRKPAAPRATTMHAFDDPDRRRRPGDARAGDRGGGTRRGPGDRRARPFDVLRRDGRVPDRGHAGQSGSATTASTSTGAPFGRAATPMATRAGGSSRVSPVKKSP
jgi:hypothetical protein